MTTFAPGTPAIARQVSIGVRKSKRRLAAPRRVIGEALRAREDARRVCEVKIAVKVLKRMLDEIPWGSGR